MPAMGTPGTIGLYCPEFKSKLDFLPSFSNVLAPVSSELVGEFWFETFVDEVFEVSSDECFDGFCS